MKVAGDGWYQGGGDGWTGGGGGSGFVAQWGVLPVAGRRAEEISGIGCREGGSSGVRLPVKSQRDIHG